MIRKKQSKYSNGIEGPSDPFRVRTKLQGESLEIGHVIPIPLSPRTRSHNRGPSINMTDSNACKA